MKERVKRGKVRRRARTEHYNNLLVIGWREWVSLPDLHVKTVKAKIDTGARTSALHAFDVEEFRRQGRLHVRFKIHPIQRNDHYVIKAEAEVHDKRRVKDSGGKITVRPVILTRVQVGEVSWTIELTLVNRDEMGFRMLLGREAVRGHLLVNPGASYLLGKRLKPRRLH